MKCYKRVQYILFVLSILASSVSYAELTELDDSKLDVLKGQAGITIDIAFKWSIGEFAYQDSDGASSNSSTKKLLPEPPLRIEYLLPGKK